jgi:DNA-binding winged helix-turn-helix (wHTH) protein
VRFQFDDFTLDLDTRELTRGDMPLHVEPKAFRLLELLVTSRPRALSKDELQDQLWPKTFVSERSLARLVGILRECLGDPVENARFIRTVPRFGYAFCGEARQVASPSGHSEASAFHCRLLWEGREIALGEGETILGRDADATVWIDFSSVSRRHARIMVVNGRATIEDLGSHNGTFVRGKKLAAATELENGDRIKIGAATLVFRSFRGLGSTKSEASSEKA